MQGPRLDRSGTSASTARSDPFHAVSSTFLPIAGIGNDDHSVICFGLKRRICHLLLAHICGCQPALGPEHMISLLRLTSEARDRLEIGLWACDLLPRADTYDAESGDSLCATQQDLRAKLCSKRMSMVRHIAAGIQRYERLSLVLVVDVPIGYGVCADQRNSIWDDGIAANFSMFDREFFMIARCFVLVLAVRRRRVRLLEGLA